ncbi:MAG: metalloregulator ArsR/SmtB family transcription factor [Pyrinomonadaceae bacterium]
MSENLESMETFFMALADRTRLRLLNLMREGEICVCYFTEALQEPQPKISRHLAYLRQAGLVETTRVGKWVYYRIAELENKDASIILQETANWLTNDEQMKLDRTRLIQISCCETANMPIAIQRAPHSLIFAKADIPEEVIVNNKIRETELADYLL